MKILKIIFFTILVFLCFEGCASHPPVLPQLPKEGKTNMGFAFSAENIIPVIWWKHAINNYTEIGYRLGIPLSGSGIDISRVLMKTKYKWDVLNLAYNIAPNSSFDLSYYIFKAKKSEKVDFGEVPLKTKWKGFRCMIIPDGIWKESKDNQSIRFGLFYGRRFGERWGAETGYFHDFKGGFDPKNKKYPHIDNNWPTQFSRGTGFSLQLFLYLPSNKSKKNRSS